MARLLVRRLCLDGARALVIGLIAASAGLAYNALRPAADPAAPDGGHGLPLIAATAPRVLAPCAEVVPPARPVTAAEARALHGDAAVAFVDGRAGAAFRERHAVGALSLPAPAPPGLVDVPPDAVSALLRQRTVVVYDGASALAADGPAARLAAQLRNLGVRDVRLVSGGLPAFETAGGPTASGPASALPPKPGNPWFWVTLAALVGGHLVFFGIALFRRSILAPLSAWLAVPTRLALAFTAALAAVGQLADPADLARHIAAYGLLPPVLVNFAAITLPGVELGIALLLLIGWQTRPAALASALLNGAILFALGHAHASGLAAPPGVCFASPAVDAALRAGTFFRHIGFLAMSIFVYVAARPTFGLDRLLLRRAQRRPGS